MRGSSKIFLVCGSLFTFVGLIFMIVFFGIVSNFEYVMRHGYGDVWLLPVIFGVMSVFLLVIGGFILRYYFKKEADDNSFDSRR